MAFLLMPIAIFLWVIGWSLYWISFKRKTTTPKPTLSFNKKLKFAAVSLGD
jgi:hypothetical protein